MDIVERLIVLIQILKTSQIPEGHLLVSYLKLKKHNNWMHFCMDFLNYNFAIYFYF